MSNIYFINIFIIFFYGFYGIDIYNKGHFCKMLVFIPQVFYLLNNQHIHCCYNTSRSVWLRISWEKQVINVEVTVDGSVLDLSSALVNIDDNTFLLLQHWAYSQSWESLLFIKQQKIGQIHRKKLVFTRL